MGTQKLNEDHEPVAVPLPERHCGRCQCAFPADPTLFFQTDWALCPACEAILFPGRRPAASSADEQVPAMNRGSTRTARANGGSVPHETPQETGPREGFPKAVRAVLVDVRGERRALMRRMVDVALGTGTVVAEVGNIGEALVAVGRCNADAAVLELRTPVVDWLAGIVQLRAANPSLVIVVCTFRADLTTRFEACDAGADAYLVKPVSALDLRRALDLELSGVAVQAIEAVVEPR